MIHTFHQSLSIPINTVSTNHHVNLADLLLKTIRTIPSYHQQLYCLMTQKSSLQQLNLVILPIPLTILSNFVDFSNALFFIQFTLEGTICRRWVLIQLVMDSTREINLQYITNGEYFCIFLARHPGDTNKSNELCRW